MTNRLAGETSPYLLQHAKNPVDWYPWGDEAFERARAEDKPVLLSIGYAACHWCHVMERESFEDPETAAFMNAHFVNVKVDREERPDVDAIYMAATQALTGSGGWPMTVFCTPDGVPFLAGTYFPPTEGRGMPSFRRVLERVDALWRTRRADLLEQGQRVLDVLRASLPPPSTEPLHRGILTRAVTLLLAEHDPRHGGFGRAPKFPQAPLLELLLRLHRAPGVRPALERTLRAMARGGVYDQLAGGFHRYATDEMWTVPHFEKMLYDNALLARVYTHAFQAFGDPLYARIASETCDYLVRDMRDEAGGFYSSEDADSEGGEGAFYVWKYEELARVDPSAPAAWGATPEGNFEGANVLVATSDEPPAELRARLLEVRGARPRPPRDDKVLTSWNGLAIGALAEAGSTLDRQDLVGAAEGAARFLLDSVQRGGRLLHVWRRGESRVEGLLEDYAYLADGLLTLWEVTFERRYLEAARTLADAALDHFGLPDGGFATTADDAPALVVRHEEIVESATPAPGAVLCEVLERLAILEDRPDRSARARQALRLARAFMDRAPAAVPTWLSALDFALGTPVEVAFTGPLESEEGRRLRAAVFSRFLPHRVLAGGDPGGLALLEGKPATERATAWVCRRYVCRAPTSEVDELLRQLDEAGAA